ncbi:hypothetical protein BBP40_001662 [Aspergillus hancockii]|nr:hypothetical protein BBP40_001662 [Aspergillus hancockii]
MLDGGLGKLQKRMKRFGDTLNPEDAYLSYYDIRLTREDMQSLKNDWLTDNIISFWEEYLEREFLVNYKSSHIVLLRPSMSFMILQTPNPHSLREALPDFSRTTHVFLPINDCRNVTEAEGGTHWSLLLISIVDGIAFHYDSLPPGNVWEARTVTMKFGALLNRNIRYVHLQDSPVQENGSDCGVFVCLSMRHLLLKRLLTANASEKVSMSLGGMKVDARGGRKEIAKIIEGFRKEGERRRSASLSPLGKKWPASVFLGCPIARTGPLHGLRHNRLPAFHSFCRLLFEPSGYQLLLFARFVELVDSRQPLLRRDVKGFASTRQGTLHFFLYATSSVLSNWLTLPARRKKSSSTGPTSSLGPARFDQSQLVLRTPVDRHSLPTCALLRTATANASPHCPQRMRALVGVALTKPVLRTRRCKEPSVTKCVRFGEVTVKSVSRWIEWPEHAYHVPSFMGHLQGWNVTPLTTPDEDGQMEKYVSYWGSDHYIMLTSAHAHGPCDRYRCSWNALARVQARWPWMNPTDVFYRWQQL